MTLTIVGAGMAGLLAANMLHRRDPVVIEAAEELPNNHHAVLRFRSTVVADTLGIPFRKVSIIKDALPWRNPVADALAYSHKNTGVRRSDRSITSGLTTAERYIAPPNLIDMMAKRVDVRLGTNWAGVQDGKPTVSTIPMPALMKLLGWEGADRFKSSPAVHITALVDNCDAYVSLLVPNPVTPISRISLTGKELSVEIPGSRDWPQDAEWARDQVKDYASHAASLVGVEPEDVYDIKWHQARYAKILPIQDDERREFIYEASVKHNIFSLGRYATWRPGLLLDDLVQDVRKIDGWLSGKGRYAVARDR
jgi:hypothetical protein